MRRVRVSPAHNLRVYVWVYDWILPRVAQQQMLYSKRHWIYSLINKSGWMVMQMAVHSTLPNVIFAWKPSSTRELTLFHSPSVFVKLSISHWLRHKHRNTYTQTQVSSESSFTLTLFKMACIFSHPSNFSYSCLVTFPFLVDILCGVWMAFIFLSIIYNSNMLCVHQLIICRIS